MMDNVKCIFFNSSSGCSKGSNCKFSHSMDVQAVCRYYQWGNCKRGSSCFYKHQSQGSQETLVQVKEDIVCAICFENPQQFGLLIGCDHVFCLKCVREWRNAKSKDIALRESNVIKGCPVCRTKSDFVVPCFKFKAGKAKEKEIHAYKTKLDKIACKYFNRKGKYFRVCPFGEHCFYAHTDKNGEKLSCRQGPSNRTQSIPTYYIRSLADPLLEDYDGDEVSDSNGSEDDESDYFYEEEYYFSDSDDDFSLSVNDFF